MRRILLLVVVLWAIWRLLAALGRRLRDRTAGADEFSRFAHATRMRRRPDQPLRSRGEELRGCAVCGVLVPLSRVVDDGRGGLICRDCLSRSEQSGG